MSVTSRLVWGALCCFLLYALLGFALVYRPRVLWDVRARALVSHATRIALVFTKSGRSRPLLLLYAAVFVGYAIAHADVRIPALMALSQVSSQFVVEFFKLVYRRVRPDYYLHRLDKGHSYPSGHATTAVVTYAGWALIALHSGLPHAAAFGIAALLVAWAVGIDWSRLALGAHYFSDVFGGTLFGIAWLCAVAAINGNPMPIR